MRHLNVAMWILVGSVGALLVATGHGPHVVGYLPFLFLIACPLIHLLMHRKRHGPDAH